MRSTEPVGFVGRQSDLKRMRGELRRAAAGAGGIVVVSGEPGIGKTWLVRQALSDPDCPIDRTRVRWARCSNAAGMPAYWPWRALLGPRFEPPATHAAQSAEELDHFEQLHDAAARVQESVGSGPLALVFDDLQWADVASLALLDRLAPEIDSIPLVVFATLRDDPAEARDPREIAALFRHKEVRRLVLRGFGLAETEALLVEHLGAPAADDDLRALQRLTGGNPYFLDELVRGRAVDELRGLADPATTPGIAKSLVDQLARRIEALDAEARRLLTWLAVLGTDASWIDPARLAEAVLAGATSPSAALDRAISARLVELDDRPGRIRFVHPLVASAVLHAMPRLELARLHGLAGTLLERETGDGPERAARLARHFTQAAYLPEFAAQAVRHSVRAGYEAALQHAHATAAEHYQSALDLWDVPGVAAEAAPYGRPELLLALAQRVALVTPPEADALLRQAEHMADDLAARDARRAARLTALALIIRCEELPPVSPAHCHAVRARGERALEALGDDAAVLRARLLASMVPLHRFERDRTEPSRLAREALRLADAAGEPVARARALEAIHWTRTGSADAQHLDAASRLLHAAESEGDARLAANARAWRHLDLLELGRIDEAELTLAAIEAAASASGEPRRRYEALCMRAGLALHRGQLEAADSYARAALELGQRVGIGASRNACHTTLMRLALERAEPSRLPALREDHDPDSPLLRSGSSYRHFLDGQPAWAASDLAAVMQRGLGAIPRGPDWLATMHTLAWLAIEIGDREAGAALHAELQPYSGRFAVYPLGAVTGSLDRVLLKLASMLGRLDEAERCFEAGLALARRADARCELAKLLHDHAQLRIARGEPIGSPGVRADLQAALASARELGLISVERGVLALDPALAERGTASTAQPARLEGSFVRSERGWSIRLGAHACEVDDLLGHRFIAALLARPGEEVLATELLRAVTGEREETIEKARLRVTARIRSALARLDQAQAEIGGHLRRHVRTGKRCGYFPDSSSRVAWRLGGD